MVFRQSYCTHTKHLDTLYIHKLRINMLYSCTIGTNTILLAIYTWTPNILLWRFSFSFRSLRNSWKFTQKYRKKQLFLISVQHSVDHQSIASILYAIPAQTGTSIHSLLPDTCFRSFNVIIITESVISLIEVSSTPTKIKNIHVDDALKVNKL